MSLHWLRLVRVVGLHNSYTSRNDVHITSHHHETEKPLRRGGKEFNQQVPYILVGIKGFQKKEIKIQAARHELGPFLLVNKLHELGLGNVQHSQLRLVPSHAARSSIHIQ